MHAKQELEALKISKQEYSTNISEAQEYSNEKAERVSLPQKNAGVQPSLLQKSKANKLKIKIKLNDPYFLLLQTWIIHFFLKLSLFPKYFKLLRYF